MKIWMLIFEAGHLSENREFRELICHARIDFIELVMPDFYPWGLYDFRPSELPLSADLDIEHQTAEELLQQEDQARDEQISLSAFVL
jgi:hypothetical protein